MGTTCGPHCKYWIWLVCNDEKKIAICDEQTLNEKYGRYVHLYVKTLPNEKGWCEGEYCEYGVHINGEESVYIHIWNEKLIHNGHTFYFCKCQKWLPGLAMGIIEEAVCGLICHEYLCQECLNTRVLEVEQTARRHIIPPIMSKDDYIKAFNQ